MDDEVQWNVFAAHVFGRAESIQQQLSGKWSLNWMRAKVVQVKLNIF